VITQTGRDPLLEAMPIGFIGLDDDWRITYINGAGAAVVGADWDELVGADYWESFPANVENEFGRVYREAVATGRPQSVEEFHPDPLNRWHEVRAVPVESGLSRPLSRRTRAPAARPLRRRRGTARPPVGRRRRRGPPETW
jgi:PAS domain-containing protein